MAFDGINFMGQQLKIRRPRDYQPISTGYDTNSRMPGMYCFFCCPYRDANWFEIEIIYKRCPGMISGIAFFNIMKSLRNYCRKVGVEMKKNFC